MRDSVRREYSLTAVLAGLCLLFALVIGLQWTRISMDIAESKERFAKPVSPNLELDELPADDFALSSIDSYAEMVAAPLTVNGRRPLNVNTEDTSGLVDESVQSDLTAKLMGVYTTPAGMIALIVDSKGNYTRIKENEKMQGWVLEKLYPDRATLMQGGNSQELLLRKPKPKVIPRQARTKARTKARTTSTRTRNKPKNSE